MEEVPAPEVAFQRASREGKSPVAQPSTPELDKARQVLEWVVTTYARDPDDPWALGHGMLALGADMETMTDKPAVDWLFEEYGQRRMVAGTPLVGFPRSRGNIRVEPHTDLVLKALMETGVPLDREVTVEGQPAKVADLYRYSLWKAWVEPDGSTSFDSLHDTPWALQGFATAAPPGLAWTASGGHAMTLDGFTDIVAKDLGAQTQFMKDAMARGEAVEKRRQGIFAYTCGGQHSIQGLAYAVARGFGSQVAKDEVQDQITLLYWRLDVELKIYDDLLRERPDAAIILLEQRLKFLGHFLESTHKMAAMGLHTPSEAQAEKLAWARQQLVVTVGTLEGGQAFQSLQEMRADPSVYQMYLDFVGDSAHALRGLDLSTGKASIAY